MIGPREPRPPRDLEGWAVVILATSLGIGWAGAILLSASPFVDGISEGGLQLLSGLGGAIVAILAARIGRHPPRL